jgi:uncharacterized membrane protein YkoI
MFGLLRALVIAIAAAASAVPTWADDVRADGVRADGGVQLAQPGWRDRDRDGARGPRLLPLEVVLANVARRIPGHHLDVDGPFQRGSRWVYRIKWLTPDGRVLIVIVDAESGQILDTRGGR